MAITFGPMPNSQPDRSLHVLVGEAIGDLAATDHVGDTEAGTRQVVPVELDRSLAIGRGHVDLTAQLRGGQ